jgi:hypothetical protein
LTLLNNIPRFRLSLLAVLLAVLSATLAAPQPSALAVCPDAATDYYYSDATFTTQVGECHHACCQLWTCTGTVTFYGRTVSRHSCSVE